MKWFLFIAAGVAIGFAEGIGLGFLYKLLYMGDTVSHAHGMFSNSEIPLFAALILSHGVGFIAAIALILRKKLDYKMLAVIALVLNILVLGFVVVYFNFLI